MLCSSPSLQTWDSNNLVIPQGIWSFCKQTRLQAVPMAEERRRISYWGGTDKHTHPPLSVPYPGRGPAVSVAIPGLQKPLEGIQSHMYMIWLSPFSWYKPGYVLNTWLVSCTLLILSHSLLLLCPQTDWDPEERVRWSSNTPLPPRANLSEKPPQSWHFHLRQARFSCLWLHISWTHPWHQQTSQNNLPAHRYSALQKNFSLRPLQLFFPNPGEPHPVFVS